MKNIAIANHLKNKLRNRTHFIITFTFRWTGVLYIKTHTDANKITAVPVNVNTRT